MSEMVERVAAAVLKDLSDRRGIRQAFDNIDDGVMAEIRDAIGRAAISAMRGPTAAMIAAREVPGVLERDDIRLVWEAMLDEALK